MLYGYDEDMPAISAGISLKEFMQKRGGGIAVKVELEDGDFEVAVPDENGEWNA